MGDCLHFFIEKGVETNDVKCFDQFESLKKYIKYQLFNEGYSSSVDQNILLVSRTLDVI